MSVKNAQVFRDRLATDAAFRTAYVRAATYEVRRQLLLDAGYTFSRKEIDSVMDHASFQRAFSDDELKALTDSKNETQSMDVALACGVVITGM